MSTLIGNSIKFAAKQKKKESPKKRRKESTQTVSVVAVLSFQFVLRDFAENEVLGVFPLRQNGALLCEKYRKKRQ